MATKQGGAAASQVPISRHPAFPAIVALWFAALLGIGSLVLPVALFETAARTTGLAAALPAAEPPLGVTARILIALVGASLGVLMGLVIARRVASAQGRASQAPRPAVSADTAKRPISAHEELWSEGFDEPVEAEPAAPIPGRRRALSVTDESGPSAFLQEARLPDGDTEIELTDETLAGDDTESDALELMEFAESQAEDAQFQAPVAYGPPEEHEPEAAVEEARLFDAPEADLEPYLDETADEQAVEAASFAVPPSDGTLAEDRPLGDLSISELVDRFAVSLQRAAERAAEQPEAEVAAETATADAIEGPVEAALPRYVPDLGVEAIEAPRFAAPAEPVAAEPAVAETDVEREEPADVPLALRPMTFDEVHDDDEPENLSLTLELSQEVRPFDRPDATLDEAADAAEPADDERCSSLLSMRKQTARREFVRIEDESDSGEAGHESLVEPVVVFPGQERPEAVAASDHEPSAPSPERPFAAPAGASDPRHTERALRDALNKLQRLSGAA